MSDKIIEAINYYLDRVEEYPDSISDYANLGCYLGYNNQHEIMVNGTVMTQIDLYLKSLALSKHLKPSLKTTFYSNLGNVLGDQDTVDVNGEVMTPKDLYLKAIQSNPMYGPAYYSLGNLLGRLNETSVIVNGTSMTPIDLYAKAVEYDEWEYNYINLAWELHSNNQPDIMLFGKRRTIFDLSFAAIRLAPNCDLAYSNLAEFLEVYNHPGVIINDQTMSPIDLYCKAINLGSKVPDPYSRLGRALYHQNRDDIQFDNGSVMTRLELHRKAIELKPDYAAAYFHLADELRLQNSDSIFLNGRSVTVDDLIATGNRLK